MDGFLKSTCGLKARTSKVDVQYDRTIYCKLCHASWLGFIIKYLGVFFFLLPLRLGGNKKKQDSTPKIEQNQNKIKKNKMEWQNITQAICLS